MKTFSLLLIAILISFYGSSQTLPAFSFSGIKKDKITSSSLPMDKPIAVFYFDPFCDQCQVQAARFKEKAAKLSGITFVFISWGEFEDIEAFRKKNFGTMSNVIFCKDEEYKFDSWFGYSEVPTIYVYNKARKRTAIFKTLVTAEELLSACDKTP